MGKTSLSSILLNIYFSKLILRTWSKINFILCIYFFDHKCLPLLLRTHFQNFLLLFLFLFFKLLFFLNDFPFLTWRQTKLVIILLSITSKCISNSTIGIWGIAYCSLSISNFIIYFFILFLLCLSFFIFFQFMFYTGFEQTLGVLSYF